MTYCLVYKHNLTILADNQGAIHMANAQKPTHQTCHVDMKTFMILHMLILRYLRFGKSQFDSYFLY